MGNDGGSIPRRSELVKTVKKPIKVDPTLSLVSKWFYCALSKKPLEVPVVICPLGKLYNKESLIEHFIDKSKYGDADKICGHIRSLNSVQTLTLMANPSYKGRLLESRPMAPFVCPLTLKEMNGNHKFVYVKPCGCVFSEAGLKELQLHSKLACPNCSKPYVSNQVMEILPLQEVQDKLLVEMKLIRETELIKKNKRKLDKLISDSQSAATDKKGKLVTNIPNHCPDNLVQPSVELTKVKEKSTAIQSIYTSSQPGKQPQNFLCRGTFNRYA